MRAPAQNAGLIENSTRTKRSRVSNCAQLIPKIPPVKFSYYSRGPAQEMRPETLAVPQFTHDWGTCRDQSLRAGPIRLVCRRSGQKRSISSHLPCPDLGGRQSPTVSGNCPIFLGADDQEAEG